MHSAAPPKRYKSQYLPYHRQTSQHRWYVVSTAENEMMKINLTLVGACVCLAIITLTEALPTEHRIQIRRTRLCGRRLVEALAFLCGNEYYEPQPLKKRGGKTETSRWLWMDVPKRSGFIDGRKAFSFYRNGLIFFRKGRGVSDECCKKSCSYSELTSYCKNSGSFESNKK